MGRCTSLMCIHKEKAGLQSTDEHSPIGHPGPSLQSITGTTRKPWIGVYHKPQQLEEQQGRGRRARLKITTGSLCSVEVWNWMTDQLRLRGFSKTILTVLFLGN